MTPADLARILRAAAAECDRLAAETEAPAPAGELLPLRAAGIPVRTLRAAIGAGELEAVRVGREYRVTREALDAWLAGRRVQPREPRERAPQQLTAAERAIQRAERAGSLRVVGGAR